MLVLVLEVMLNVLLGVLFQRLAPMEIANALSAKHRDLGITTTIDNPDYIPIGLSAISHESLELLLRYTMPNHDVVEILLEDNLRVFVFGLKITACNGHDTLKCRIVNLTSHSGPISNTFDMIKYYSGMLKISAWLHPPN